MEKDVVRRCISDLPGLRKCFRFKHHFVVEILDHYSMGSSLVCAYRCGKFDWQDGRPKSERL